MVKFDAGLIAFFKKFGFCLLLFSGLLYCPSLQKSTYTNAAAPDV